MSSETSAENPEKEFEEVPPVRESAIPIPGEWTGFLHLKDTEDEFEGSTIWYASEAPEPLLKEMSRKLLEKCSGEAACHVMHKGVRQALYMVIPQLSLNPDNATELVDGRFHVDLHLNNGEFI